MSTTCKFTTFYLHHTPRDVQEEVTLKNVKPFHKYDLQFLNLADNKRDGSFDIGRGTRMDNLMLRLSQNLSK